MYFEKCFLSTLTISPASKGIAKDEKNENMKEKAEDKKSDKKKDKPFFKMKYNPAQN
ncbi:hypothetical protein [Salinimicrobium gaetbulicola]|uniref:Uncharacterized protein n=1 Tax=Salinimicrobium gaetbulicola TaxID=999702 RepID=A0ABW3IID1_9FLAO